MAKITLDDIRMGIRKLIGHIDPISRTAEMTSWAAQGSGSEPPVGFVDKVLHSLRKAA